MTVESEGRVGESYSSTRVHYVRYVTFHNSLLCFHFIFGGEGGGRETVSFGVYRDLSPGEITCQPTHIT